MPVGAFRLVSSTFIHKSWPWKSWHVNFGVPEPNSALLFTMSVMRAVKGGRNNWTHCNATSHFQKLLYYFAVFFSNSSSRTIYLVVLVYLFTFTGSLLMQILYRLCMIYSKLLTRHNQSASQQHNRVRLFQKMVKKWWIRLFPPHWWKWCAPEHYIKR